MSRPPACRVSQHVTWLQALEPILHLSALLSLYLYR